jgi:hypothetical protein
LAHPHKGINKGKHLVIDFIKDALTLDEASTFLNLPTFRIGFAVMQGYIRCGVIARSWRGLAVPSRNDIPLGPDGHKWDCPGVERIFNAERKDWACRHTLIGTDVSYLIRTAWAGHFWYLHHSDAYKLFNEEQKLIDVKFLEPLDGVFHHKNQPDRYPDPEFVFWVDIDQPNRKVTFENLLFLKQDLDRFRVAHLSQANHEAADSLGERAETTYLNIIGGLLALMLSKSPAGMAQSVFDSQAAIISELLAHYENKPGIAKRTLEEKFAEANRSLKST